MDKKTSTPSRDYDVQRDGPFDSPIRGSKRRYVYASPGSSVLRSSSPAGAESDHINPIVYDDDIESTVGGTDASADRNESLWTIAQLVESMRQSQERKEKIERMSGRLENITADAQQMLDEMEAAAKQLDQLPNVPVGGGGGDSNVGGSGDTPLSGGTGPQRVGRGGQYQYHPYR